MTPPRLLRPLLLVLALVLAPAALPRGAHAQVPDAVAVSDTIREFRLEDGSIVYGRVVAVDGDRITVETPAGARVELRRGQIRQMRPIAGRMVGGEMWMDDPHGTRLFFGPTGRPLGAGRAYVGVYELIFPFLTYGVTPNFSISGGTPIVAEALGEVFYVAPKLTVVQTDRFAGAVGVLAAGAEGETAGLLYGVGTLGNRSRALSVGIGWAFVGDEIAEQAVMMVGGETQVGPRIKLLSENYFAPGEEDVVVSFGIRFFSQDLSADLGIGTVPGTECDGPCWFPLVNFVYSFGGR